MDRMLVRVSWISNSGERVADSTSLSRLPQVFQAIAGEGGVVRGVRLLEILPEEKHEIPDRVRTTTVSL